MIRSSSEAVAASAKWTRHVGQREMWLSAGHNTRFTLKSIPASIGSGGLLLRWPLVAVSVPLSTLASNPRFPPPPTSHASAAWPYCVIPLKPTRRISGGPAVAMSGVLLCARSGLAAVEIRREGLGLRKSLSRQGQQQSRKPRSRRAAVPTPAFWRAGRSFASNCCGCGRDAARGSTRMSYLLAALACGLSLVIRNWWTEAWSLGTQLG